MRCDECKYWKRGSAISPFGICSELPNDNLEVLLITARDGGVVDYIETAEEFFCAEFKEK